VTQKRRTGEAVPKRASWRLGPAGKALAVSALFLLATIDDRHAGRLSDERQVVFTAIAITETGSLKLAADPRLSVLPRDPEGDPVSRYGLDAALIQVPAALVAPSVERSSGPLSSGPLFLIAPFLLVLSAAWAAGRIATALGGSETGAALAVLLTAVGSPLGAYSAAHFSEPLQAAALGGGLAAALSSVAEGSIRRSLGFAAATGALVGVALLTKSVLLVIAPPLSLPLLCTAKAGAAWRRAAAAAAGFALPALLWAATEWKRFGTLLGGYGEDSFSHPLLDGLL
jgi:hypothetical protein